MNNEIDIVIIGAYTHTYICISRAKKRWRANELRRAGTKRLPFSDFHRDNEKEAAIVQTHTRTLSGRRRRIEQPGNAAYTYDMKYNVEASVFRQKRTFLRQMLNDVTTNVH